MIKRKIFIEPSIFCGDLGNLAKEAKRCEEAGADALHVDVMDGHFVPNFSMGPAAVSAINRATDLFLDVHLMIYNPFDYIEMFAQAGADCITFHFEATENIDEMIDYIRKCNVQVGIAFNPETSSEMMIKYLEKIDVLLLMSVHPGFGGQKFIPEVLDKISFARSLSAKQKIKVDGGLNLETGRACVKAGADVIVSGSYLFKQKDMSKAIAELKGLSV